MCSIRGGGKDVGIQWCMNMPKWACLQDGRSTHMLIGMKGFKIDSLWEYGLSSCTNASIQNCPVGGKSKKKLKKGKR